jgi:hypothetical protein
VCAPLPTSSIASFAARDRFCRWRSSFHFHPSSVNSRKPAWRAHRCVMSFSLFSFVCVRPQYTFGFIKQLFSLPTVGSIFITFVCFWSFDSPTSSANSFDCTPSGLRFNRPFHFRSAFRQTVFSTSRFLAFLRHHLRNHLHTDLVFQQEANAVALSVRLRRTAAISTNTRGRLVHSPATISLTLIVAPSPADIFTVSFVHCDRS